jgi:hypothetical protein
MDISVNNTNTPALPASPQGQAQQQLSTAVAIDGPHKE